MTYRFGRFDADRAAYRVSRQGTPLDLTPKLLDLLFHFLDRPGQLVTKEELLDAVWPGANVTDNAVAQAISDLREALDDEASSPTYILTISRRGYRFIAPVEAGTSGAGGPAHQDRRPASMAPSSGELATLAVMDFTNVAQDAEVAWLGAGIAETVTSDLAALDRYRVVDRGRVVEAARRTNGSLREVGAALGARLMVTGGFQRAGGQLRLTARLVDLAGGEVLADAKVDGPSDRVFALQDEIARAFARELGVPQPGAGPRAGVRETTSLDAYRAYMEGWLKIESLDLGLNVAAIRDFERAIAVDPGYAMAYTGLANAEFVAYEMGRGTGAPNFRALQSAIDHARHAIHLDEGLAEAHATLSFLLASAFEFDEARRAAQRALTLEPDSWRHRFRLGHASWGEARLRALDRALDLYPQFAFARFEIAMVHVARGRLNEAFALAQAGAGDQDRQAGAANRFPVAGFHWLRGGLLAVRGDIDAAIEAFDREVDQADAHQLYRAEFAAAALVWRGHVLLGATAARDDEARAAFARALTFVDGHARARLGVAAADARLDKGRAAAHRQAARDAVASLQRPGREPDSSFASACEAATFGEADEANRILGALLDHGPASWVGWTIPIEPAFAGLRPTPGFDALCARLAGRAR